jgi:hypothetical protein
MEDDAVLVPQFREGLRRAMRDVPRDFDILVLGCFFLCNKRRKYSVGLELVRPFVPGNLRNDPRTWGTVFAPEHFGGAHCYVVSATGCRKLLRLLPKAHFHIDSQMNHPELRVYAVSPNLASQRDMRTSSMASYAFPKTLTPLLQNFVGFGGVSLAYSLDVPWAQVAGMPINAWALIFMVLGLWPAASLAFAGGIFVAELGVGGDIRAALLAYALGWAISRTLS